MSETTGTDLHNIDRHLTSKIVRSYVEHHTVGTGEVSGLITSVHGALSQLGRPNQPEEILTPAVPVRQSVRHDYVVCLDCGYRGKLLLRHIVKQHGLSRADYLTRWGLRSDHPLTAPDHSRQRSMMAKELGFGRKAKEVPPAAPTAPASARATLRSTAKPRRRRSTGSAAKSDIVNEVAVEKTPAKQRQSRSRGSRAKA